MKSRESYNRYRTIVEFLEVNKEDRMLELFYRDISMAVDRESYETVIRRYTLTTKRMMLDDDGNFTRKKLLGNI